MRFRAPSDSVESIAPAAPAPQAAQRQPPTRKPHVTGRRARARDHKLQKIKAAAKGAAKRNHRTKQIDDPCTAFIGNIGPDVDENALITYFSRYGKILSARIHCCGGVAMTVKPPPASYHKNMKVSQYGIMVFGSKVARYKACKMGGTLGGRKLVVSIAISDIPEVQEKIVKRLDDYRARLEPPDMHRAQKSALRSLKMTPTVLLDHKYEARRKQRKPFRVMGISLQEGIM